MKEKAITDESVHELAEVFSPCMDVLKSRSRLLVAYEGMRKATQALLDSLSALM